METPVALSKLDLSQRIEPGHYEKRSLELQLELVKLQRHIVEKGVPICIVFEGMDAAGKGGAIKRLTQYLDPRGFAVHAIGPPDQNEFKHHYLRRFWLRLPPSGSIAIFDRSWYGRLLVEPIEKLIDAEQYARAQRQICDFEQTLCDEGMLLLKFWLHVDKEEQLRRFKDRENDPLRVWKLTAQDWHNREHFEQYMQMADRMFNLTHTDSAPWYLVPGNDKHYARIKVLETIVTVLKQHLQS